MTKPAAIARENASTIEVKKHAYRQTQDGIVISFVMHPNEVPDTLATAPLGTRYMAALVEIGDDEQPISRDDKKSGAGATAPLREADDSAEIGGGASASRPKQSWREMTAAQQAGILCKDIVFRRYLYEQHSYPANDPDSAAVAVREICGVISRTQIATNVDAMNRWHELVTDYRVWQMVPV